MMKIYDNKIYHDDEKIGWIDGAHVYEESGKKLGYAENEHVYNEAGQKIAYIQENHLGFENGQASVPLQHVNDEIQGTIPILMKCAIFTLFDY